MRAPHILLILLVLVALGAHAYVSLQYEYRDASNSVKYALGLGFAAAAAAIVMLLSKKGRGAPIIIPALLLAMLVISVAGSIAHVAHATTVTTNYYSVTIKWRIAPDIHDIDYKLCSYTINNKNYNVYLHGSVGENGYTNPRFKIDVRKSLYDLPVSTISLMPNTTTIKYNKYIILGWVTKFLVVENSTGTYVKTKEWHRICPRMIVLKQGTYRIDSNAIMTVKEVHNNNTTATVPEQNNKNNTTSVSLGLLGAGALAGLALALLARKR